MGIADITGFHIINAFNMYVFQSQRRVESQGGQHGDFAGSINPFHVCCRIGLSIAFCLRFCQCFFVGKTSFRHPGQHIVGSTVNNTHNTGNLISGQAGTQRTDDRNTAANRAFKLEIQMFFCSQREQCFAIFCQYILVGGYHMFSVLQRCFDIFFGRMHTANQFHYQINFRIV